MSTLTVSSSTIYTTIQSTGAPYITINTSTSYYSGVTMASNINYNTVNAGIGATINNGFHVSTNARFDGDLVWKGKDLGKLLESIEHRLAILEPDINKLEKFAALKKAYEQYKVLEALCFPEDKNDN